MICTVLALTRMARAALSCTAAGLAASWNHLSSASTTAKRLPQHARAGGSAAASAVRSWADAAWSWAVQPLPSAPQLTRGQLIASALACTLALSAAYYAGVASAETAAEARQAGASLAAPRSLPIPANGTPASGSTCVCSCPQPVPAGTPTLPSQLGSGSEATLAAAGSAGSPSAASMVPAQPDQELAHTSQAHSKGQPSGQPELRQPSAPPPVPVDSTAHKGSLNGHRLPAFGPAGPGGAPALSQAGRPASGGRRFVLHDPRSASLPPLLPWLSEQAEHSLTGLQAARSFLRGQLGRLHSAWATRATKFHDSRLRYLACEFRSLLKGLAEPAWLGGACIASLSTVQGHASRPMP